MNINEFCSVALYYYFVLFLNLYSVHLFIPEQIGSKMDLQKIKMIRSLLDFEIKKKHHLEEFYLTKWLIRIRKSKKDRQHNGRKKRDKRINNDLQNTTLKTNDRTIRIPLKISLGVIDFKINVKKFCTYHLPLIYTILSNVRMKQVQQQPVPVDRV